jgi:hypothetical protein
MMDLQVAELIHVGKRRSHKRSFLLWELGRRLRARAAAVLRERGVFRRNPMHTADSASVKVALLNPPSFQMGAA